MPHDMSKEPAWRRRQRRRRRSRGRYSDEMFQHIPKWLALGATKDDIAVVMGTTRSSLEVMCSRRGISLVLAGRRTWSVGPAVTDQTLRRSLTPDQVRVVYAEARARGVTAMQLVYDIVAATAQHDLFKAVLGDYDAEEDAPACAARS